MKKPRAEILLVTEDLLARATPSPRVAETISDAFGISKRQARRYIRWVRESWRASSSAEREELLGDLFAWGKSCYREARQKGHPKAAINALRFLASILGLATPSRVDLRLDGLDESGAVTSRAAILERLKELRAEANSDDDGTIH